MEEIRTSAATPEQLLQTLEAQLAQRRSQRGKSRANRLAIMVAAVLFIVVAAGGALFFLSQILSDMRDAKKSDGEAPATPHLIETTQASGTFFQGIRTSRKLRPPTAESATTTTAHRNFCETTGLGTSVA